jgi:predicted nucleic acid-binding protein
MDSLIAAIAIAHNLQLVTDNEKDFPHMDLVNPLK